ncbi:hypothetical protein THAOC_09143 [Thalassiosira oceanica]|uniref:Bromo domain-containing protein n=1 Tax=Thalassiosira oceanica TaxID=159749 RepID=K0TGG0_THAOC|nr:hypothetical protein THAOC_09143 [Thalassiosira oceanica]|eukprot:EJK69582.1 hypothetical protein THAOC_09143 [Thalassiosira oceanica]
MVLTRSGNHPGQGEECPKPAEPEPEEPEPETEPEPPRKKQTPAAAQHKQRTGLARMGHGNGVVPPPTPQFPMLDGLPVGIQCLRIVNLLLELPNAAAVFGKPVDTVKYDLPTYFDVVKKPMDLGTVSKKLTQGKYQYIEDFESDMHLTFNNAMLFNGKGHVVSELAQNLKNTFDDEYKQMMLATAIASNKEASPEVDLFEDSEPDEKPPAIDNEKKQLDEDPTELEAVPNSAAPVLAETNKTETDLSVAVASKPLSVDATKQSETEDSLADASPPTPSTDLARRKILSFSGVYCATFSKSLVMRFVHSPPYLEGIAMLSSEQQYGYEFQVAQLSFPPSNPNLPCNTNSRPFITGKSGISATSVLQLLAHGTALVLSDKCNDALVARMYSSIPDDVPKNTINNQNVSFVKSLIFAISKATLFDDCGYYSSKPTSMEENDLHLEMLSRNVYLYFNYCTTLPTSVIDSNKIGNNWRKTSFQQMLTRLVEVSLAQ